MIDRFLPRGWKVGSVHEIRLPTFIRVSKKTQKACNLNIYRNLHHHHLNKQKQTFHDEVKPLLAGLPFAEKIWIHYTIFASRGGRLDTMNVGSIVDKYFSDTLVEAQKIPDDDYNHVVFNSFSFGGVHPIDGHAIATIHILERDKENTDMRILLDQEDIQAALETHVETMGIPGTTGVELSINNGEIVAEVTFGDDPKPDAKPKPKNKGGRPRGLKNKPKSAPKKEAADDSVETAAEGSSDTPDSTGSESTETDTPKGEEKSDDQPKAETKGSAKGNLFGDEESQSSESADAKAEGDAPKTGKTMVTEKKKKSSIFDV